MNEIVPLTEVKVMLDFSGVSVRNHQQLDLRALVRIIGRQDVHLVDTAGLDVKYRSTSNQFAKIPAVGFHFFFSDLEFPDQAGNFDGETI